MVLYPDRPGIRSRGSVPWVFMLYFVQLHSPLVGEDEFVAAREQFLSVREVLGLACSTAHSVVELDAGARAIDLVFRGKCNGCTQRRLAVLRVVIYRVCLRKPPRAYLARCGNSVGKHEPNP